MTTKQSRGKIKENFTLESPNISLSLTPKLPRMNIFVVMRASAPPPKSLEPKKASIAAIA